MMALKRHMMEKIENLLVNHKETFISHLNDENFEKVKEEKNKSDKKKKKSKARMLVLK